MHILRWTNSNIFLKLKCVCGVIPVNEVNLDIVTNDNSKSHAILEPMNPNICLGHLKSNVCGVAHANLDHVKNGNSNLDIKHT